MLVCHFINPDLVLEIFSQKRRDNWKMERWFWNRGLRYLCTLVLGAEKNSCRACLLFVFFFGGKDRITLKNSLDLYSITWLLNYFNSPSYGLQWRNGYSLRLLLMSLGRGDKFCKLFCLWGGKRLTWGD